MKITGVRDKMKEPIQWLFADVNNDGFLDMFITNEESTNRLYITMVRAFLQM